jgi:hypothetical protein
MSNQIPGIIKEIIGLDGQIPGINFFSKIKKTKFLIDRIHHSTPQVGIKMNKPLLSL